MDTQRILAIDDEQIVLDSVRKVLAEEGFQVATTLSGREGLEMARRQPFDLVLTDIRMPDIGGMRVLRDLKRSRPALPVVMITGYGTVRSAVEAMRLGAANYLEKPFTPNQLVDAVREALRLSASVPVEPQAIIHEAEFLKVLELAASDPPFIAKLLYLGSAALEDFDLTGAEKLAILTGDITWIEQQLGPLTATQRRWLEQRVGAEIW